MDDKEKNISNDSDEFLKPSVSSLDIIREREHSVDKELSKKVEQYNYKQGMEKVFKTVENNQYNDVYSDNVVNIKPPRKRIDILPFVIILILVGVLYGSYSYFSEHPITFTKKNVKVEPVVENSTEPENVGEDKNNIITCKKSIINNDITNELEYIFVGENDNLKKLSYNFVHTFRELPSSDYVKSCNNLRQYYNIYEGYSYVCDKLSDYSYEYKKNIDFEVLQSNNLAFKTSMGNEEVIINEHLDDSISELVTKIESNGYTCEGE